MNKENNKEGQSDALRVIISGGVPEDISFRPYPLQTP